MSLVNSQISQTPKQNTYQYLNKNIGIETNSEKIFKFFINYLIVLAIVNLSSTYFATSTLSNIGIYFFIHFILFTFFLNLISNNANIYNSNKEILTQLPSNFNNKFLDPSKIKWLGLTMSLSYILSRNLIVQHIQNKCNSRDVECSYYSDIIMNSLVLALAAPIVGLMTYFILPFLLKLLGLILGKLKLNTSIFDVLIQKFTGNYTYIYIIGMGIGGLIGHIYAISFINNKFS